MMQELSKKSEQTMQTAYALLKKTFGYDNFRGTQEAVIRAILAGRDALAIMPTGAGKSICYQIPALMLSGITIVVSPLVSLMKDQVGALVQAGVAAAFLNNSLNDRQKQLMLSRAEAGWYKIIYVAPERLAMPQFLQFAQTHPISMVTVDESHCISQWGQDFRPSYLQIQNFVKALPTRPIVSAFTATATTRVRDDIIAQLGLHDPFTVTSSFDRPNLHFAVQHCTPDEKPDALLTLLEQEQGASGIVYCSSVKQVDETTLLLQRMGYPAARYHSKVPSEERQRNQDDFLYDRVRIMVATNAFGMGIDKPNVRFVVHYNMPKDLEGYYQEAGRAGRDGDPARCTMLYAGADVRIIQYLIDRERDADNDIPSDIKRAAAIKAEERLQTIAFYANTKYCLRQYILRYFGERNTPPCQNCSVCETIARVKAYQSQRVAYPSPTVYGGIQLADNARVNGASVPRRFDPPVFADADERDDIVTWHTPYTPQRTQLSREERQARLAQQVARTKSMPRDAREEQLLEQLFLLRKRLAAKQKIPAYMVFSDAILRDICRKKPVSMAEFLQIEGVGEAKADHFGPAFIRAVQELNVR